MDATISLRIALYCMLFALGFSVFSTPLEVLSDVYIPQLALFVRAIDEVVLAIGVLALGVGIRQVSLRRVVSDWFVRLAFGYVVLHLLYLLHSGVHLSALTGVAIDTRFIVASIVVYVLVRYCSVRIESILRVVGWSMCIVVLFGAMQWILPKESLAVLGYGESTVKPYDTIDSNESMVRHQSFLRGPNPLGAYMIIAASLLLSAGRNMWKTKRILWISMMAVVFFVLYGSHSRGAWLGAGAACSVVLTMSYTHVIKKIAPWLAVACVLLVSTGIIMRDTPFISQVILHENPANGRSLNSNDQHLHSLADGFERMIRQPLGAGVGTTGTPSLPTNAPLIIENHYFYIAHEVGWLGLVLFLVLFGYVLRQLWVHQLWAMLGAGVGLAVVALFLPVWADEAVSLTWWVLSLGMIATKKGEKNATN